MVMATFYKGGDCVDHTPAAAVTAGDVVVLAGGLIGVAKSDIAANKLGALAIRGNYKCAKATGAGTGFDTGVKLYWDPNTEEVTATAGVLNYMGVCANDGAVGDDDTEAVVALNVYVPDVAAS